MLTSSTAFKTVLFAGFLTACGTGGSEPEPMSTGGTTSGSGSGGTSTKQGSGGNRTGGSGSGAVSAGGSSGGDPSSGGTAAGGETMSGGAPAETGGAGELSGSGGYGATGGYGSGGTGTGGGNSGTGGGDPGETCPLPDSFAWSSSGPLAQPREGWVSLKDFTAVVHEDEYIVYMTNHDTGTSWGAAMFTFGDWAEISTASQQPMDRSSVAPTLLYFEPKDVWVLAYQWGSTSFSYATSSDPTDPSSWSAEQSLYNYSGSLPNSSTGPIDQHLICDDTDCYLFFNGDNGEIYRSSMPIEDFPGTFGPHETIMSRSTNELFEAVAVYSLKGSDEYLMLMESIGSNGRYFSAFTASDLGGEWTDLKTSENDPFAGRANVTFEGDAWTNDISHGDLVRYDPDQRMEVDPCHLELLYQGRDPSINTSYELLPYRPGLLTLQP